MLNRTALCLCVLVLSASLSGRERVEHDVVYGMFAGTALLMDVYYPEHPNGHAIVMVAGNGWRGDGGKDISLKASPAVQHYSPPLLKAGYTLFSINHRGTPAFTYPAAVEDVEAAVRFIRQNAAQYGINKDRIGGWGSSSGGHLVSLVALQDARDRAASRLQCVAAVAPSTDFLHPEYKSESMPAFMGFKPDPSRSGILRLASPITHVTNDDPPMLIVHGDRDAVVPYDLSVRMIHALQSAGVPAKLVTVPGGTHDAFFRDARNAPDYRAEIVQWFDRYLPTF